MSTSGQSTTRSRAISSISRSSITIAPTSRTITPKPSPPKKVTAISQIWLGPQLAPLGGIFKNFYGQPSPQLRLVRIRKLKNAPLPENQDRYYRIQKEMREKLAKVYKAVREGKEPRGGTVKNFRHGGYDRFWTPRDEVLVDGEEREERRRRRRN